MMPKDETIEQNHERYLALIKHMSDLRGKKVHDYGLTFKQHGVYGLRVRISDKYGRFERLLSGIEPKIDDESVKDTALDMANYLIMLLLEMEDENWGK